MAFGAKANLLPGTQLARIDHMISSRGMAAQAFNSGPDLVQLRRRTGVTSEAGANGGFVLFDSNRGLGRTRNAGLMTQSEIEPAGLAVITDSMLEPPGADPGHRGHPLIASTEGPIDSRVDRLAAALGRHIQGLSGGRIRKQKSAASFADRSAGKCAGELGSGHAP